MLKLHMMSKLVDLLVPKFSKQLLAHPIVFRREGQGVILSCDLLSDSREFLLLRQVPKVATDGRFRWVTIWL
jgi:hypothetical protein